MLRHVLICTHTGKTVLTRTFANQTSLLRLANPLGQISERGVGGVTGLTFGDDSAGLPPTIGAQLVIIADHMYESTGFSMRTISQGPVLWALSQPRKINGEWLRCIVLTGNEMPEPLAIHLSDALLEEFADVYRGEGSRQASQSEISAFAAAAEISIITAIQRLLFDVMKPPFSDIRVVRTPGTGQALLLSPSAAPKGQGKRIYRTLSSTGNGPSAPALMATIGCANRILRAAFPSDSFGPCSRVKLSSANGNKVLVLSSIQIPEGPSLISALLSFESGDEGGDVKGEGREKKIRRAANGIAGIENAISAAGIVLASLSQVSLSTRSW